MEMLEQKQQHLNIIYLPMKWRRTFDESGDYIVKPFQIKVREGANNRLGNNGVFDEGGETEDGGEANDDLGLYQVSSGKAYVKGYEVNKVGQNS